MRTVFGVIIAVLLAVAGMASAEEKRYAIPPANSPQKGAASAPVTLVEFLDFQ